MSGLYYRHIKLGHIVHADGPQPKGRDTFAGTVVWSPDEPEAIVPGTFSSCWLRVSFERTTIRHVTAAPAPDIDTVESTQHELDVLRHALGVDAEPLDTLPERMLRAAASYRKLYEAVKAWESEA